MEVYNLLRKKNYSLYNCKQVNRVGIKIGRIIFYPKDAERP